MKCWYEIQCTRLCICKLPNPLNPIVHFWLHHSAQCAEKIISACYVDGSASAKRVGQGKMGGFTRSVTCAWWLLGLTVKAPRLGPGRPILALTAWTGLENVYSHLVGGSFQAEQVFDN